MSKRQFEILMIICKKLDIRTLGELEFIKSRVGARTNDELIMKLFLALKGELYV